MAVTELHQDFEFDAPRRPDLRLVPQPAPELRTFRSGPLVQQRRAARAAMLKRRRRVVLVVAILATITALCGPGHAFGGTTATGLPIQMETGSQLASGQVYVVQAGDTLSSIAEKVNPLNPHRAFVVLRSQIRSSVVLTGEHILIP